VPSGVERCGSRWAAWVDGKHVYSRLVIPSLELLRTLLTRPISRVISTTNKSTDTVAYTQNRIRRDSSSHARSGKADNHAKVIACPAQSKETTKRTSIAVVVRHGTDFHIVKVPG
jgi:hypothetical protein